MENPEKIGNEELIDYVYYEIAGEYLNQNITDWSKTKIWYDKVFELSEPVRFTYCIGILNGQVMNGGFEQYYDNDYGIFAEETLKALSAIGADLTFELLNESIEILKKHKNPKIDLFEFITKSKYWDNPEIESVFDRITNCYGELGDKEDLTELLAEYLKKSELK
jgi:hypothetical protein